MPVDLVRDAAVDVLLRVFERDVYLDESLNKTLRRKKVSDRGRRFMTQLVYGTVRYRILCDHVLKKICHLPLKKLPAPIHTILRMGVYQDLFCDQVTHPAMVHTSVDLAKRRGHAGTARLVNAVLRKAPQDLNDVKWPDQKKNLSTFLSVRYSMPVWLVEYQRERIGEESVEAWCAAMNQPAPVSLRVNLEKTTPEKLIKDLAKAGFEASSETPIPEELTLAKPATPIHSKVFQRGHFMIQDPASMLPAHLLEPQPGDQVLDMCAAPGGKTTHLAALAQYEAHIVAMDCIRGRVYRILDNVDRLETPGISVLCGDGGKAPVAQAFDRVLVDAPCSGLGTLRRHPDMKWRSTPESFTRLGKQQVRLLRSAVDLCKNGGLLVYSVCTQTQQETIDVVQQILAEGRVRPEDGPEWLNTWKTAPGHYQTRPFEEALDGFFLIRLRKLS